MDFDFSEIEALLREVGAYQLEGYRKLEKADVKLKEGGTYGESVVTEYDVETERRVFDFLSRRCPGDSFLGEESGNVRRDPSRYWILDPIDGTTNFTQGVVYWGPSLALWDRQGPAAGWIYLPAVDQIFHARRGEGAFLNGTRIHSSTVTEYSDLCSVGTTSRLHRRVRLTVPAKHRILGSLIVNLAYLATGTLAASFCRANVWDVAAGILIAREAGAVVDCRPAIETLDLASIDVERPVSLTIYGRANAALPSLEGYLVPLSSEGR
ncbi:MAG: inositol monophosphatase [Planctomycetes bacterium]|nr:inositol monophosphatase [Planctomycetota bacterium]